MCHPPYRAPLCQLLLRLRAKPAPAGYVPTAERDSGRALFLSGLLCLTRVITSVFKTQCKGPLSSFRLRVPGRNTPPPRLGHLTLIFHRSRQFFLPRFSVTSVSLATALGTFGIFAPGAQSSGWSTAVAPHTWHELKDTDQCPPSCWNLPWTPCLSSRRGHTSLERAEGHSARATPHPRGDTEPAGGV